MAQPRPAGLPSADDCTHPVLPAQRRNEVVVWDRIVKRDSPHKETLVVNAQTGGASPSSSRWLDKAHTHTSGRPHCARGLNTVHPTACARVVLNSLSFLSLSRSSARSRSSELQQTGQHFYKLKEDRNFDLRCLRPAFCAMFFALRTLVSLPRFPHRTRFRTIRLAPHCSQQYPAPQEY